MINLRIPATSANLGAGFDALGLAVSHYNYVNMEEWDGPFITSLDDTVIPTGENNLIYATAKTLYDICGRPFSGLRLEQTNNIPMTRGLGSSSACIIAGLVGANTLLGEPLPLGALVDLSAQLEGHPDNTAPALLGGIVTAVFDGRSVHWVKQEVGGHLSFIAIVPDFELKTEVARACLPKQVPHADAVYNLSRAALFSSSLLTGKYENLRTAVGDRLHQPFRLPLIPRADEVMELAYSLDAYAAYISGAGPTIMVIVDPANTYFTGRLRFSLDKMGLQAWRLLELAIDNDGTVLIESGTI